MESIAKIIKDPTWWFTAVLIGILVSLIASYLRDFVSWFASKSSSVLRARREKRLEEERVRIELLVAFPELLTMEITRAAISVVIFLATFSLYVSYPGFIETMCNTPEMMKLSILSPTVSRKIAIYLMPLLGVVASLAGFRANARLRIVVKARGQFEKQCKEKWEASAQPGGGTQSSR